MKNKHITAVLNESATETGFCLRISLIEDICNAKRLLWALGDTIHNEFMTPEASAILFDDLYELDIVSLEVTMKGYSARINELMILKLETV
jgi:hypothetical protein